MHRKRPVLKRGDVCRVAKKFRHRINARVSYVVIKVLTGDGSDKYSRIQVAASVPSRFGRGGFKKPFKLSMCRNMLWYTGHNIYNGPFTEKPKQWEGSTFSLGNSKINSAHVTQPKSKSEKGPHKCHCFDSGKRDIMCGCICNGL